jgi:hypothetical protein
MQYTPFILFASGLLGVITHNLMKIDKLNRDSNGNFKFSSFIRLEWASILISVIVIVVAMIAREEIKQLKEIGSWLAIGFYSIGLAAQSVAYFFNGKAEKILKDKADQT